MDDWRKIARNSLRERNWLPAIKRFLGDPKLAASYLPIAQTILGDVVNRANLGGIGYLSRIVNLPDGTVIKAIFNGGINVVSIDTSARTLTKEILRILKLYMESGLIDALIPVQKTLIARWPEREVSGLLYRAGDDNPLAQDILDALTYKIGNTTYKVTLDPEDYPNDGGKSRSLWFTEKEAGKPPDMTTEEYEEYLSVVGVAFQDKKAAGVLSKPCNVTGKLKLYQQSILARNYEDETVRPATSELPPYVFKYYGIDFNYEGTSSIGLTTTDEYEYWLIKIYQSSDAYVIQLRKLTPTAVGKALTKYLNERGNELTANEILTVESHILAYSIPMNDQPWYDIGQFDVVGFEGSPIAYGWKFNWDGSEASIVVHETRYTAWNVYGDPTDYVKYARLGQVRITFNDNFDPEVAGSLPAYATFHLIEEVEDAETRIPAADTIWTPNYLFSVHEIANVPPLYPIVIPDPQDGLDFPVYCFYPNNPLSTTDELRVVRYKYNESTTDVICSGFQDSFYPSLCTNWRDGPVNWQENIVTSVNADGVGYSGTIYEIGFGLFDINGNAAGTNTIPRTGSNYIQSEINITESEYLEYDPIYPRYHSSLYGPQDGCTGELYGFYNWRYIQHKGDMNISIDVFAQAFSQTQCIPVSAQPSANILIIPFDCGNAVYLGHKALATGRNTIQNNSGHNRIIYVVYELRDGGDTIVHANSYFHFEATSAPQSRLIEKVLLHYGDNEETIFELRERYNPSTEQSSEGFWYHVFTPNWISGELVTFTTNVNSSLDKSCYYTGDLRYGVTESVGSYPDSDELSSYLLSYFIGHAT